MLGSHVSSAVAVVALWFATVALLAGAWAVTLLSPERWLVAGMLAATSCLSSTIAVVVHAGRYTQRVVGLVRATSGLSTPELEQPPRLRAVQRAP